eukprot:COSAG06_NODE_18755_length_870_cov_1.769131_1_plen_179_part_10
MYGEHAPSTVATALTEAILAAETDNDDDNDNDSNGDSAAATAAADGRADGDGAGHADGYADGYGGHDDGAARPSDEYEGAPDDWDAAAGKKTPVLHRRYTKAWFFNQDRLGTSTGNADINQMYFLAAVAPRRHPGAGGGGRRASSARGRMQHRTEFRSGCGKCPVLNEPFNIKFERERF